MQVILLQDVRKIGKKYEIKEVASGHALNLLIPRNLALTATEANKKKFESLRSKEEQLRKISEQAMLENLKKLEEVTLKFTEKVNKKGHLFAAVHTAEIVAALKDQAGLAISPEFLDLDKPIKEAGEHIISAKVQDKTAKFKVVITAKEE